MKGKKVSSLFEGGNEGKGEITKPGFLEPGNIL